MEQFNVFILVVSFVSRQVYQVSSHRVCKHSYNNATLLRFSAEYYSNDDKITEVVVPWLLQEENVSAPLLFLWHALSLVSFVWR
jgi:osmotically-inducible protein OsmY